MTLETSPEIAAKIRRMIDAGWYPDANNVLRDALSIEDPGDQRLDDLRAKLELGEIDVSAGRLHNVNPAFWAKLLDEAQAASEAGEAPDPDVLP